MAPLVPPLMWIFGLATTPGWSDLETILPATPAPIYDSLEAVQTRASEDPRPVLFRDRQGLNPYCQQVWLGLEAKGIDYVTVLVDDDSGDLPKIQWPDGTLDAGDSLSLLKSIQTNYPEDGPDLYKRISKAVDNVGCNIVRFRGVFPRNTDDAMHAPFLFRDGELVPKSNHMVSLEETDEVLEEYDDGPFLCGDFLSAADIVWAPFLERYAAQLPLVPLDDMTVAPAALRPRSDAYEAIVEWCEAMEELVPSYVCRIGGDRYTWERTFVEAVKDGLVPAVKLRNPRNRNYAVRNELRKKQQTIWSSYISDRPYLCATPEEECVAFHIRNRQALVSDISDGAGLTQDEADEAVREVLGTLLSIAKSGSDDEATAVQEMSEAARVVAVALDERMRAPRDVGILPASTLRHLVNTIRAQS